jgi:diacylglycerol kinase family enzyme
MRAMRALLVHNPNAGSGRPSADELLAALDAAGFSTTYCSVKSDDLDAALAQPADIVIAAGGDGTVAKIARKLKDRKTLVAILPFGTANNIARCLGIGGDPDSLVKGLRGAPVARLDIGQAVGPWGSRRFVEAVGWGAIAKSVDRADPGLPKQARIERGRATFAEIIADYEARRFVFTADDETFEEDLIFVEALNLGMTGPRMIIGPTAQPGDQLLDIVYLPADRRQEMLDWLADGPDDRPAPLTIRKARKATLSWVDGPLRVDDQVFDAPELTSNIIVELEPDGLRVCVPAHQD